MNAEEEAWEVYTVARQDFRRACESAIRADPGSQRAKRAALRLAETRVLLDAAVLAAVAEARAPLVEALRAVEWVPLDNRRVCVSCGGRWDEGHKPRCNLAAALAKETP